LKVELNAPTHPGRISLTDSHSAKLAAMNQRIDGLVHLPGSCPLNLDTSPTGLFLEPVATTSIAF
jgi:hypothetical protein